VGAGPCWAAAYESDSDAATSFIHSFTHASIPSIHPSILIHPSIHPSTLTPACNQHQVLPELRGLYQRVENDFAPLQVSHSLPHSLQSLPHSWNQLAIRPRSQPGGLCVCSWLCATTGRALTSQSPPPQPSDRTHTHTQLIPSLLPTLAFLRQHPKLQAYVPGLERLLVLRCLKQLGGA
jgi:hypothetical protein